MKQQYKDKLDKENKRIVYNNVDGAIMDCLEETTNVLQSLLDHSRAGTLSIFNVGEAITKITYLNSQAIRIIIKSDVRIVDKIEEPINSDKL